MMHILYRCCWQFRKNSIDQTVPENWREMSEKNATYLQKHFHDNKVDIVVNAYQTFVYFYTGEQVVVVTKGVKRVG